MTKTKEFLVFFFCAALLFSFNPHLQAQTPDVTYQKLIDADMSDSSDWGFYPGAHLRTSFNMLNNTVDLEQSNHDDEDFYVGYAYDITLDLRHLSGFEIYGFIERRGRADYDAPLSGKDPIYSLFGRYNWYTHTNMFPRLREFWMEVPLIPQGVPSEQLNVKAGLFPYGREIGHKIALGGKYENYGVTVAGKNELIDWNLHVEAEDYNNRIQLGQVPNFDKEVNKYNHTSAIFTAADAVFNMDRQALQCYIGWLRDETSRDDRDNVFATKVKSENLLTAGADLKINIDKLHLGLEGAKNFGSAKSIEKGSDDNINHTGYLLVGDVSYDMGSFKPKAKGFIASGNKLEAHEYNVTEIPGNQNRAFSVFSPLNKNLTDTHYQKQFGPYVAMAGGYAVNFGVKRPGTFGDPFMFENLVAGTVGFDYTPVDKAYIGIDYWVLRCKENAYGLDEWGDIRTLPKDLGSEIDFFVSYQLKENVKLSLLGGYFFPGEYYTQKRSDTATTNIFAPTPRRNGEADVAYQLEFGLDITF